MLYEINQATVSLQGEVILDHIDFEVRHHEKIAIVGRNGTGKTTLLRLIAGELEYDRDDKQMIPQVRTSRKLKVEMLRQQIAQEDMEKTVSELFLKEISIEDEFSRERFYFEKECDRFLTGFGLKKEDKERKLDSFSGGEQTKISMIRLLLSKPDILLLDEPTNHLDLDSLQWLEDYLRNYDRAVIMVSHDRFFMDQVAEIVYELNQGHLKKYNGNYTEYKKQKKKQGETQRKRYEQQQEELKHLNELIEKFKHKPKKAAFARSRKKIIERMELIEKPDEDQNVAFSQEIVPEVLGSKWMLETEHLKIGYEEKTVLNDITLRIKKGQKIGIIGPNGVGKTTFLKTAAGKLMPLNGKCTLGNRTVIGYFDQMTAAITSEKTVLEHFHDLFPSMIERDLRTVLGRYLFSGKKAAIPVNGLSGGEKARLCLAELLESRPNFLILDEPTNHMDIPAKEALEAALRAYTGTLLFISHDRYFIDQVADAIFVFEKDEVQYYPFGYEHYISRKRKGDSNPAALVRAEDETLLSSMKAVPKAERHRLEEIDTEEAYLDWQFALVKKQMRQMEEIYEKLYEVWALKREEARMTEWAEWMEKRKLQHSLELPDNASDESQEILKNLEDELLKAEKNWTRECLAWGDLWMESMDEPGDRM